MTVVRYADDHVLGFQYRNEADRFLPEYRKRLAKFELELHPDNTRRIEFGRFAERNRKQRGKGKPETFDFLGFTHLSGKNRIGDFRVKRKTIGKRMRATLEETKRQLLNRAHDPIEQTGKWLRSVVQGYFNYHTVPGNTERLHVFRFRVTLLWRQALTRRSQRHRVNWVRVRGTRCSGPNRKRRDHRVSAALLRLVKSCSPCPLFTPFRLLYTAT